MKSSRTLLILKTTLNTPKIQSPMEDCLLICLKLPPPGKGLQNFMEHYLSKESSLLDMYMSCQSRDNPTAWVCSIHNRSMKCWARVMTQDGLFFPRQIKHYHPTSTYGTKALKKEQKGIWYDLNI